jgi:hypothetical protein
MVARATFAHVVRFPFALSLSRNDGRDSIRQAAPEQGEPVAPRGGGAMPHITHDAYRGNHQQLADVKHAYDPHNLFRINKNIEPTAVAADGVSERGPTRPSRA